MSLRIVAIFLFLVLLPFHLLGAPQPYSTLVTPKQVKHTGNKHVASREDESKYVSITPKIHDGIWPDFCLKHLHEDPEGCSAWAEDDDGKVMLEFVLEGHAHAHIERALIDSLGHLAYLIPTKNRGNKKYCDYAWCPKCQQTVKRSICVEEDEYDEGCSYLYFLVYKCGCTGCWWLDLNDLDRACQKIYNGWQFCKCPTIYHGYFDWHNQTYFRHLKNILSYVEENPTCTCYWPQIDSRAKTISDLSYTKLDKVIESTSLLKTTNVFSPYLIERSKHGLLTGLFSHSFFYTHYHEILSDLDQHGVKELSVQNYALIHPQLVDIEENLQQTFVPLYTQCLQLHPHPKIYYERGMVLFHRGENLDSLDDIRKFIAYAEDHHYSEFLNSDLYLKEGRLLSESLSYDEAIVSLTKALQKDPKNIDAYFERAMAYFEKGDFSKALSDYLASGFHPQLVDSKKIGPLHYASFGQGVALGIANGGHDSVSEFIPSLLASLRGISKGIWALVSHPIAVSQDMIECSHACLEFVKDHTTKELLGKIVPELQECIKKWDQLDDGAKGRYIGYVMGKYGIDIFIGSGSVKAIQLYRNLRKANALMTLESAATSPTLAHEISEQSLKQKTIRESLVKSFKLEWDKQGKHVQGHRNYLPEKNKSILTHPDPQKLIDNFAGTGLKDSSHLPGKPGYKELVDFGEIIGYDVHPGTGQMTPTTWGKIHYSKNGVHIVPTKPR